MTLIRLIFIWIFMLGGLFFFGVGTLGLFRFDDVLNRAHSSAKCDTLGALLCSISLIIYSGFNYATIKLVLVIIFLWMTNPTATHLIANAALNNNKEQYKNQYREVIDNEDI